MPRSRGTRIDLYVVQVLDGYTDGRPSWRQTFAGDRLFHYGKEAGLAAMRAEQEKHPARHFRLRKKSMPRRVG